jgi:hypothetical protein
MRAALGPARDARFTSTRKLSYKDGDSGTAREVRRTCIEASNR